MDARKTLEVVVLGGTLVLSMNNAFGQVDACSNGSAISGGVTSAGFVRAAFNPKCSANVYVSVMDSTASFSVKSASAKGKTFFGGSTESGGIAVCATFATFSAPAASANGC